VHDVEEGMENCIEIGSRDEETDVGEEERTESVNDGSLVDNGDENEMGDVNSRKRKSFVNEEDVKNLYLTMENICEICGQAFNERRTLYFHKRNSHFLKYQCNLCHRKFLDQEKLDIHKKTHITRLQNNCHLCPKTYLSKQSLKKHYYSAHLKFIEDMISNPFPIMFINVFDVK